MMMSKENCYYSGQQTTFLVIDTCKTCWIGYYAVVAAASRALCCAANLGTDLP